MTTSKALVFDIKRFAVHDGDGIRTTIFFKGCPPVSYTHLYESFEKVFEYVYFFIIAYHYWMSCHDYTTSTTRFL